MADYIGYTPGIGALVAADDIGGLLFQRLKIAHGQDGSASDASALDPFPVGLALADPQTEYLTGTSLSAGGNADLTATDIPIDKIGRLVAVEFGAAVPLKVQLQTISSGARTTRTALFSFAGSTGRWNAPDLRFVTQAGGDDCGFGVSITNLDTSQASDVYATLYWDEI